MIYVADPSSGIRPLVIERQTEKVCMLSIDTDNSELALYEKEVPIFVSKLTETHSYVAIFLKFLTHSQQKSIQLLESFSQPNLHQ